MIDLVLLHPPSIYDFRKRNILFGPISDVIPSTPIFEMYPLGFVSLAQYLEKNGYKVRIINIAMKMLGDKNYDVEKEIASLNPKAFGIDLHWLPHCQGGLKIAEMIKKYHPDIPTIFGGLSATYFHKELIQYPQVDFVIRGDSAEEPLLQLIKVLNNSKTPFEKADFSAVPNLTYKNNGEIKENSLSWIPQDLNHIFLDYSQIAKSLKRDKDLWGYLPFSGWESYPILAALTCRGCTQNCPSCGGSEVAYDSLCKRKKPAYRDPELVIKDIKSFRLPFLGPVFIIGDIRQPGDDYADLLLALIKKEKIQNHLVFEFFELPSPEFIEKISKFVPNFNIQITTETHDQRIRPPFRSYFDNESLEKVIQASLKFGCRKFDLFFMIGLPHQNPQSVMDTVNYCDHLLEKYSTEGGSASLAGQAGGNGKKNLSPFISPLAPFVDPGSLIFENPKVYGYTIFYRTLEEHRRALESPSWKYMLNYQTEWMSRDQIVDVTYQASLELNRIKLKHRLISPKRFEQMKSKTVEAMKRSEEIDMWMRNNGEKSVLAESPDLARVIKVRSGDLTDTLLKKLPHKDSVTPPAAGLVTVSPSKTGVLSSVLRSKDSQSNPFSPNFTTICEKDELKWSVNFLGINLPQWILKTLALPLKNILKRF